MRSHLTIALAATLLAGLTGCRGGTSSEPPILLPTKAFEKFIKTTSMDWQPKVKSQAVSTFYADGRGDRVPPDHTIARGKLRDDPAFFFGKNADGTPLERFPVEVNPALLDRGRERYNIYCAPCHDQSGGGQGLVPKRGWIAPPSFHQPYLRAYVPGQFYGIVTNGIRSMPGYAKQIPERDRWAIVAWIQVLQRSQFAKLSEVPENAQGSLK